MGGLEGVGRLEGVEWVGNRGELKQTFKQKCCAISKLPSLAQLTG